MIHGSVDAQLLAKITVYVEDVNGQTVAVDATIDTAYTGSMTLPPATIANLALPWLTDKPFELADGRIIRLDVYAGVVV